MAAGVRPGQWKTTAQKLARGIWPWNTGVRAKLPEHFKKNFLESYMVAPIPVHYKPEPGKYRVDKYGTRYHIQNVPIPIIYPREADKGLWGGEGIVQGYAKKENNPMKPKMPKMWKPRLQKRVFYSEILDRWMEINVTPRTLDLIDEAYGFDCYILKTHQVDLKSKLGMKLKREMIIALANKTIYPSDPQKRDAIYEKYKEFIIPVEEAEWLGLDIDEAEWKQKCIDEEEKKANTQPLKKAFAEQLLRQIQEAPENEEEKPWLSKLNPFKSEPKELS